MHLYVLIFIPILVLSKKRKHDFEYLSKDEREQIIAQDIEKYLSKETPKEKEMRQFKVYNCYQMAGICMRDHDEELKGIMAYHRDNINKMAEKIAMAMVYKCFKETPLDIVMDCFNEAREGVIETDIDYYILVRLERYKYMDNIELNHHEAFIKKLLNVSITEANEAEQKQIEIELAEEQRRNDWFMVVYRIFMVLLIFYIAMSIFDRCRNAIQRAVKEKLIKEKEKKERFLTPENETPTTEEEKKDKTQTDKADSKEKEEKKEKDENENSKKSEIPEKSTEDDKNRSKKKSKKRSKRNSKEKSDWKYKKN